MYEMYEWVWLNCYNISKSKSMKMYGKEVK